MAGGLIGTGLSYENNALQGMIRESAEQQQIDEANRQIKAQKSMQKKQTIGQLGGIAFGIGAMLLFLL